MKNKSRDVSRREFMTIAGAEVVAVGLGPAFLFPERAAAQQKTLTIAQWRHFVPGYDKWFDDVFAKPWGQKHNTRVIVDHMAIEEINASAAKEAAARQGHDLFLFLAPPAGYEKQVIDHAEIYQEVEKKHGKAIPLAHRSTLNPKTKKYFAFSDSYAPDPGNCHKGWWADAGYPNGPDTWDELRIGARKIRERTGHPCGLGLSQEVDSDMALRALLWSFGGAEQDERGSVTINSKATVDAVKYMRALFQESQTREVFTWSTPSASQSTLAGRTSYAIHPISITRQAERERLPIGGRLAIQPALQGPAKRIAPAHVTDCYAIWNFARNKEGAKQFLVDYMDSFGEAFQASEFYNFPCFPSTVPNLARQLSHDDKADPPDKYKVLANASDWTTNIGYPGYANAATEEVLNTFVVPTMFAQAARDEMTPEAAVAAAEKEIKRIFDKWKTL